MRRLTFLASLIGLPLLGQKRTKPAYFRTICGQNLGERPFCFETDDDGKEIPGTLKYQDKTTSLDEWPIGWKEGKALNNQCPQCGTMAEPFKPVPVKSEWGIVWALPTSRDVACDRCNCVFRQAVEE